MARREPRLHLPTRRSKVGIRSWHQSWAHPVLQSIGEGVEKTEAKVKFLSLSLRHFVRRLRFTLGE